MAQDIQSAQAWKHLRSSKSKDRILPFLGLAGIELLKSPDVRQQRQAHRNLRCCRTSAKSVRMPIVIINNEQAGHAVGNSDLQAR